MKPRFVVAAGGVLLLLVVASRLGVWPVIALLASAVLIVHYRASRALRRAVEGRCRALREAAFDTLVAMGVSDDEAAEYEAIGQHPGQVTVLVDQPAPDTLRVVVRGSMNVFFYTLIRFDGFYAKPNGDVQPMKGSDFDALE
jgi:hypothetical protein